MSKSRSKSKPSVVDEPSFTAGSGNVFLDLGFPEGEAACLMAQSYLMIQVSQILKQKRWNPEKAAKILKISPSRVAQLKGRPGSRGFTVDQLIKLLARLGKQVTVIIEDKDEEE